MRASSVLMDTQVSSLYSNRFLFKVGWRDFLEKGWWRTSIRDVYLPSSYKPAFFFMFHHDHYSWISSIQVVPLVCLSLSLSLSCRALRALNVLLLLKRMEGGWEKNQGEVVTPLWRREAIKDAKSGMRWTSTRIPQYSSLNLFSWSQIKMAFRQGRRSGRRWEKREQKSLCLRSFHNKLLPGEGIHKLSWSHVVNTVIVCETWNVYFLVCECVCHDSWEKKKGRSKEGELRCEINKYIIIKNSNNNNYFSEECESWSDEKELNVCLIVFVLYSILVSCSSWVCFSCCMLRVVCCFLISCCVTIIVCVVSVKDCCVELFRWLTCY